MEFKNLNYKFITAEEMNQRLKWCKEFRSCVLGEKDTEFRLFAFINVKKTKIELSYRDSNKFCCTYITFLDCRENTQMIKGMNAFTTLSRYYKVPRDFSGCNHKVKSSPILWKNEKYEGKRFYAYSYDINSSYSWAMQQDMPDARSECAVYQAPVKNGYIGFDIDGNRVTKGFAFIQFPLIESPFKRFVEVWYNRKRKAKTALERNKAKQVLNYCVGYLQNINPYIRSQILGLANERIMSFRDEDTVYMNTDSIVSIKKRNDIVLSDSIGGFKNDHCGYFAFKGYDYQWDFGIPAYRGIPKSWFPPKWDILKDPLPKEGGIYRFNEETIQLEEIKYENKETKQLRN